MRWDGPGKRRMKNCDIYYGDCYREQKQRLFGCGFVIRGRLRQEVLSFRHVSERLMTIRIKAKFANIRLICAHAPTEDKDDATKECFYELLDQTYEQCPKYDVKIVLGDFNAKTGKEDIFGIIVGKHSLHGGLLIMKRSTKLITLRSTHGIPPVFWMSEPSELPKSTRRTTLLQPRYGCGYPKRNKELLWEDLTSKSCNCKRPRQVHRHQSLQHRVQDLIYHIVWTRETLRQQPDWPLSVWF